jgi:hypothetical protein
MRKKSIADAHLLNREHCVAASRIGRFQAQKTGECAPGRVVDSYRACIRSEPVPQLAELARIKVAEDCAAQFWRREHLTTAIGHHPSRRNLQLPSVGVRCGRQEREHRRAYQEL